MGDGAYLVAVAGGAGAGPLPTIAWALGLLLIAAAPAQRTRSAPLSSSSWAKVGIPAVSAAGSLPIVFFAPAGSPRAALASVALGLIVVRLTLSLLENERLLRSVQRAATTDQLTGLANRQLLLDRIAQGLVRQLRRGDHVAVLSLDIDEFKVINETHGHAVGDRVLVAVGERLRDVVRGYDTVCRSDVDLSLSPCHTVSRLGGDEFAVVLEGLHDAAGAAAVAQRLLAAVQVPLLIADHETVLDASVGITLDDGTTGRGPIELLRDADIAMYAAKMAGKRRYQFFETEMHKKVAAANALIRDLRGAVAGGQLRLLYQPQVDVCSGCMTGVEALVRWEHPTRGLLSPDRFILVAEDNGMIAAIDEWVLRQACWQMRAWDSAGLQSLHTVAVNVSGRSLVSGDLADTIGAALRANAVDPARLELEIT